MNKKYTLPAGLGLGISLCFIFILRYSSLSMKMIVEGLLLAISSIMLIIYVVGIKNAKLRKLLPFVIFMFLAALIPFVSNFLKSNNILGKDIISLLCPIVIIGFFHSVSNFELTKIKNEKKIKHIKLQYKIIYTILAFAEIYIIYAIFILNRN